MELRAQLILACHPRDDFRRQLLRLQRAQPHPLDARGLAGGLHGVAQVQAQLLPIGRQVDARQHHFFVPGLAQLRHLLADVLQGLGAHPAPGVGDDAVGAEPVAAVLDF